MEHHYRLFLLLNFFESFPNAPTWLRISGLLNLTRSWIITSGVQNNCNVIDEADVIFVCRIGFSPLPSLGSNLSEKDQMSHKWLSGLISAWVMALANTILDYIFRNSYFWKENSTFQPLSKMRTDWLKIEWTGILFFKSSFFKDLTE